MSTNSTIERIRRSTAPDSISSGASRDWINQDNILCTTDDLGNTFVHDGSAGVAAHVAALDPHPQYTTVSEASASAPVQSVNSLTGAVVLTKSSIGLGNVDNTSDVNKPTSTDQLASINSAIATHNAALDPHPQYTTILEASAAAPVQSVNSLTGTVVLTKSSIGLANVDNTSDVNKPTSTAQLTSINSAIATHNAALDPHPQYTTVSEASAAAPVQSVNSLTGAVVLTKSSIGLGNVDNTSDVSKPTSTAQLASINSAISTHNAALDPHPQYTTVSEASSAAPVQSVNSLTGAVVLTKSSIGLSNVDNTSDVNKPTSTAQLASINSAISTHNVSNRHIDHSAVIISGGNGLIGSGDLTSSFSIELPEIAANAGVFGSSSTTPIATIDVFGRVVSYVSNAISIASSAITDFGLSVRNTVLTGFSTATNSAVLASDSILVAIGKLQAQINAGSGGDWQEKHTLLDQLINVNTLTLATDLAINVVATKQYLLEYTLLYRSVATNNGIGFALTLDSGAVGDIAANVMIPQNTADGTNTFWLGTITASGDQVISTSSPSVQPIWHIAEIKGIFRCTSSGTLNLRFRSETSGNNVNLGAGSNVLAREF